MFIASLMTIVPFSGWAQNPRDHAITGKLMFDQGVSCENVKVELEVAEMQPIESVYADPMCTFRFVQPMQGAYLVHVDVDGYQEIHQRVDSTDAEGYAVIQMIPAPGRISRKPQHTQAAVDVSEIMDQYPKKAVDLYNKGLDNHKKGKNEQAIKQLQEALKIAPNFYQVHNTLGILYRDADRFDDAEEQFVQAHQINAHNPEPLVNLSSLYLEENKPERAAEVSENAVLENSRSAPALFNWGIALYKLSKFDKAEEVLKRALDVAPKMAQVHLALANVYLKLRRYDSLLDQLNAFLDLNPNAPEREQVEKLRNQVLKAKSDGTI